MRGNVYSVDFANRLFTYSYIARVYTEMKKSVDKIKDDYAAGKIERCDASRFLSNLIDRNNTEKQRASNVSELERLCGLEDLIKEAVAEL
jgi:hypothetical protein